MLSPQNPSCGPLCALEERLVRKISSLSRRNNSAWPSVFRSQARQPGSLSRSRRELDHLPPSISLSHDTPLLNEAPRMHYVRGDVDFDEVFALSTNRPDEAPAYLINARRQLLLHCKYDFDEAKCWKVSAGQVHLHSQRLNPASGEVPFPSPEHRESSGPACPVARMGQSVLSPIHQRGTHGRCPCSWEEVVDAETLRTC